MNKKNKLSIRIISFLITLVLCFGIFTPYTEIQAVQKLNYSPTKNAVDLLDEETTPEVQSIKITNHTFNNYVGKSKQFTANITDANINREQINIKIGNKNLITINENSFQNNDDKAVFKFTIKGKKAGKTTVTISSLDGTVSDKINVTVKPIVKSIKLNYHTFKANIGKSKKFTVHIKPAGIKRNQIKLKAGKKGIVKISEKSFKNVGGETVFKFTLKAKSPGSTSVKVSSSNGKISDKIRIKTKAVVKKIKINKHTFKGKVGKKISYTAHLKTAKLKRKQIKVIIGNKKVVKVIEKSFKTKGNETIFKFTIKGKAKGKTYVKIASKNGKISDKIKVTVTKKSKPKKPIVRGTTVYITPTGKKYHYSRSCAGKNAIKTTLSQAKKYHDPCKKCAK